jgi:ATP/maltotriose-dependent transcriptional regulator MalT
LLTGDDSQRRAQLLCEAGGLLTSGGGCGEALDALEGALALVPAGATRTRAEVLTNRAEARRRGGRSFVAPAELERALAALSNPEGEAAQALRLELAMNRYWHADFSRVRELAVTVRAEAQDRGDQLLVCLAASLSSLADICDRRVGDALASFHEAQAAFTTLSDERLAERIYIGHYLGQAALRLERADDALAHIERCFEVAHLTGQDATAGSWWGIVVQAQLLRGDVREAERAASDAIEMTPLAEDDWRRVWMLGIASMAALWAGSHERALASALEATRGAARTHPETFLPLLARVHLGAAALAAGDPGQAIDELAPLDDQGARSVLDLHAANGWDALIRARLATGQIDAAADAAARAESRVDPMCAPQHAAIVRCARSNVSLARGDAREAAAAAEQAVALAQGAGNPLTSGRSHLAHGRALAAAGELERAIGQLERAEEMLWACGATREADAAARQLRQLGRQVTRRPRRDDGSVAELSPREREVANEVAAGKTNRDIAATLFLSEKTIESHLARIYTKLDVHSRAALTAIVMRHRG